MSDWRHTRRLWLPFVAALWVQAVALLAFWSLRLYAGYNGLRPPASLEVVLLIIALIASAALIALLFALLRISRVSQARSVLFIGGGLLLAVAAFTSLLLVGRGQ